MGLLIQNGTIVTAADTYQADILVEDEKVKTIGLSLASDGADVLDASGKYIFPGFIDAHTHLDLPFRDEIGAAEDFRTGTIGAAHGGTTCVIDFAFQLPGQSLRQALDGALERTGPKAVVDYGFHIVVTDFNEDILKGIPDVVEAGVSSFKLLMAYKGILMTDDTALFNFLKASKTHGTLVSVHAENGDVIDALKNEMLAKGLKDPVYFAHSKPPECEDEATNRAIQLAKVAESPLYIVHLSSVGALKAAITARQAGQPVFVETCPQYLHFNIQDLEKPDYEGAKWVCQPPLRPPGYQDVLWNAVVNGGVDVVATDHGVFPFRERKELAKEGFDKIIPGVPGIEERPVLMYESGVVKRGMSLNRYVDLLSTAPARIFGLYPEKGTLAPGSDADIVIFDPKGQTTLKIENLHYNSDFSIYEGMKATGRVESVFVGGKAVVKEGNFVGEAGSGKFIKRKTFRT